MGGEDYDYDSQPYTSDAAETSPLKEAEVKDFWALDFRRKLAAQQQIGKNCYAMLIPEASFLIILGTSSFTATVCFYNLGGKNGNIENSLKVGNYLVPKNNRCGRKF